MNYKPNKTKQKLSVLQKNSITTLKGIKKERTNQ